MLFIPGLLLYLSLVCEYSILCYFEHDESLSNSSTQIRRIRITRQDTISN